MTAAQSTNGAGGPGAAAGAGAPAAKGNHLVGQTSPYLLQHAHNPVDWWPWGEAALAEAKRRNVPIFLSVGYSTCYWCHVMERESFEDEVTAKFLNEHFVCIKVDREERPDIDEIYMTALQQMTHRGGWPMSVWLTPPGTRNDADPGLEPFYAGTYYPPEPRPGMSSFASVLRGITDAWTGQREQVLEQAGAITQAVRDSMNRPREHVRPGQIELANSLGMLLQSHDATNGGFGRAPKFPQPVNLEFLLDMQGRFADPAISSSLASALRVTLDKMAMGGMFDQLGGGFHRYSTDERWLVPHFEKMLYDQAQLIDVYARAFAIRRDPFDALIVRRTIDYVLREMCDPETGAFWSAQDAEVNEREGQNYLWTPEEVANVLGEADAPLVVRAFGLDQPANFRDPHHPEDGPRWVLALTARPDELAAREGMKPAEYIKKLDGAIQRLLVARRARPQPHTDGKVITAWNGLMIGALADGAIVLGDVKCLDAAERAAKFFLVNMRTKTGGLFRIYRDTKARTAGFLEDYAFLIKGLLSLHRANAVSARADTRYLEGAEQLTRIALERFGSESFPGGLYDTRDGQSDLLVRGSSIHDGALPSGQSVMLHDLLDLYEITRKQEYLDRAVALLGAFSNDIVASPLWAVNSTRAILRFMAIGPATLDPLGAERKPEQAAAPEADAPVKVLASTDRVAVPPDGKGEVTVHLKLEIDSHHHINAHVPGVEGMTGLAIEISGGTGVSLAVEYPKGVPYTGAALPKGEGPLMVHSGELELDVRLSRTGDAWTGRPLIVVTYQACTDTECMQPQKVALDVALDPS